MGKFDAYSFQVVVLVSMAWIELKVQEIEFIYIICLSTCEFDAPILFCRSSNLTPHRTVIMLIN